MIRMVQKTFYMMRHGETEANAEGYAAGSMDVPLTEKGRAQAVAAREVLATLEPFPSKLVYSNLSRARETARLVNQSFNLPEVEEPLMAEQCFGDWAGQPWRGVYDRIIAGEKPPNGESKEMLMSRVERGLAEILATYDEPVLIVTHGGVFDALLWMFRCKVNNVKNCHIYRFSPARAEASFPWEIWHHAFLDDRPVRIPVTILKGAADA